ncbi:MAG: hypothetical protein AB1551_08690 [Actinomycetota bacterium]
MRAIAADVASGAIAPDVRVAMYNPERWKHTPLSEQRDPCGRDHAVR